MQGLSSNDGALGLDEESLRRPLDPDVEEEQSHNSIISEEDSAFEDQTPAARKGKKHRKAMPGFSGAIVENLDSPSVPKGNRSPSQNDMKTKEYESSTIVIENQTMDGH